MSREAVLTELLRAAHMRLIVSEGNVELTERIEAVLAGDPLQRRADEIHRADCAQDANREANRS